MAENCCEIPKTMLGLLGATVIDTNVLTVKIVVPEIFPWVAVIVVAPIATDVAKPFVLMPSLLPIVATAVAEELHLTALVISLVEPSE